MTYRCAAGVLQETMEPCPRCGATEDSEDGCQGALSPLRDKVTHVKRARQTRNHECHWPGCTKQVPPAMWGCYPHWMKLPRYLRAAIWAAYRPGQEIDLRPSETYLAVAERVQEWIATNHPR